MQAIALVFGGTMTTSAMAANCTWNPATGNWSTASDWSCGIVPSGGPDTAIIDSGKVVTVNTAQSILNLTNSGGVNIDAFLFTLAGGGSTTNTGTINVGAGPNPNNAALQVGAGHNINNTGGVINVSADSVINQFGSTISGGTIATTGTGALVAFSSGGNFLSGVTLNGTIDLTTSGNAREQIINDATLNGATVNIANGGVLSLNSANSANPDQLISGTGTINLNDPAAHLSIDGNGSTTLGLGITVHGQGSIGTASFVGGTNTLINNGLISADVNGGTLSISPPANGGSLVNNATLQASGGGTLALAANTNNAAGQISAQNGSVVQQNGVTISGGTLATSGTGVLQANSSGGNFLSGVTLNGTFDLTSIGNAREQIINGATLNGATVNIANGGVLSLNSANSANPDQLISGTGTINLNDPAAHLSIDGNGSTTLDSGITVRGQGSIGTASFVGGTNTLINNGLISADVNGGTLSISPPANGGSLVNNANLQASGGGTLVLAANTNNAAGQISAQNDSVVQQNGVTISGGTLATSGTGVLQANGSAGNFLSGVTLNGTLDLTSIGNAREQIINGATINGAVNVANGGILGLNSANTSGGNQSISGIGTINLNDAAARLSIDGNGSTTLDSGITVRGQGNIGTAAFVGGSNTLTSNGLISADVIGGTLNIAAPGGGGSFINNGTLQAINGGTLLLSTNITANLGSQILSGAGSNVVQNGISINGVFTSSGGGNFTATSSASNILNGVNFAGTLNLGAIGNARERIVNGLMINGAINVANGGILSLDSAGTSGGIQTVSGTASINLNDAGARLAVDGNGTTTLGSGITVHGQGNIGQAINFGGANTLINEGLISADTNGGTLNITAPGGGGSLVNNNTLQATGGGTLQLSTNTDNTNGQITAQTGSAVVQNSATITGGTIDSAGNGVFQANGSGSNFLSGVMLNGTLDLTTIGNARERIINGAEINGAINVANGGILSLDSSQTAGGSQTISGTGVVNLNDAGARLAIEGNGSTTLGSDLTVRGQGNIGSPLFAGGANTLTNNGLISADVNGGTLNITTPGGGGSLVNNNILQAINGGTLQLTTNTDNTAGQIIAQTGSAVVQNGATIIGGAIDSAGSGAFQANGSSNFLSGVTLNGTLDLTTIGNARERIINGAEINGAVNIANGGILSLDSSQTGGGSQTISGTGVINLNDAGARLSIEGNGSTTLGSDLTVRGQGNIGTAVFAGGNNTLVNNGLISADVVGGSLNITSPANGGSLTSNGTLEAITGGTLALNTAVVNNGTISANDGNVNANTGFTGTGTASTAGAGVLTLGANSSVDNLLNNGSAANALNLGTHNINVSGDYNNGSFGTGNSFNNHANVSGTGQILAEAGTSQGISGAGVTNGGTAAPTIALGNVRVGTPTTQTFQVDNTGTGASLRGAIQTAGGGAGLDDARLSVTPQNFGAVTPGGSSAPVAITFNAATAGLISLSGSNTLGIVNNFDNVAGQLLNITTAAGAAVYNVAAGSAAPSPITVANQRVGDANSSMLTITNTAPGGVFTEGLNASFTGTSGQISSNGGAIALLAGGASNNTAMSVGVDTSSAGAKSGSVTLGYQSDGTGTSGLSAIKVGSQSVNVSGDVYRLAEGNTTPAPVAFGNSHVGDTVSQTLTVQNTAAADGFSEKLNASFGSSTGSATNNSGTINLLAAGDSNNSSMSVGLDTSSAGAKSGSVGINYVSDGIGTSGLSAIAAGSQNVTVSGDVYRLASANTLGAVSFGNVHVGESVQQALSITNTAVNDGFSEKLNASFGSTTDSRITSSGSISLLGAGASDNISMIVGLDTSAAGTVIGTQTVLFASDGAGTSGLGITGLPSQGVNVSGDITTSGSVYRLASASPAAPNPVDFGNVRIGTFTDQALSITNTAANDGFSEKLNASISTNGSPITATGAFNLLGPQATDNTSLHVGIDTTTAGAKSGAATIALASDGTGTSGLGVTNLSPQTVNVSGDVYRLANPVLNTGSVSMAARVGDASPTAGISITNNSPDIFTEGLKASAGIASAEFSGGGSINNLAAGGTDTSSIHVALNTGTAGSFADTLTTNFTSTGAGTTGASNLSVGSASTNLTGHVYQTAEASISNAPINFGIVHVGDVIGTQALDVSNIAPVVALNDTLNGSFGGATGPFTASGNFTNLATGSADNASLVAGLNTSTAGVFNETATASFASHNPDMTDLALPGVAVQLIGQVNNYANPDFALVSGAGSLTGGGLVFNLDFGNVFDNSGIVDLFLKMANDVLGPADLISGGYDTTGANDFIFNGFNNFTDLAAGMAQNGLQISFDTMALGLGQFADTVLMNVNAHNASGYQDNFQVTLNLKGQIIANNGNVPEPESLLLMAIGLSALLAARRRRRLMS